MNCSTTSSKYALAFNNLQPPSIFIDDNEMSVDPRWHDAQTLLPGMSTTVVAVTWTCAFLGSIMFLLRVYVNDRISHSWNISFWFSLATYVSHPHSLSFHTPLILRPGTLSLRQLLSYCFST